MGNILTLTGISKSYRSNENGKHTISVIKDASLALKNGEFIGLVAPSGAGKSTFLHIAGLLETANAGKITIGGAEVENLNDRELSRMRLENIGFIYQFHHLLVEFSALENVILPQIVLGKTYDQASKRAHTLLDAVGLSRRANHKPAQLSGGEKQRIAFCRALANNPKILIADEPTGNLDPQSAERIFTIMLESARKEELGALIATHNLTLAQKKLDRILTLENGTITPYH